MILIRETRLFLSCPLPAHIVEYDILTLKHNRIENRVICRAHARQKNLIALTFDNYIVAARVYSTHALLTRRG